MYLRKRHPKTLEDMSNLADYFIDAHGYSPFFKDFEVRITDVLVVEPILSSNHLQLHHISTTTEGVTFVIEMDIWQKTVIPNRKFHAYLLLRTAQQPESSSFTDSS